MEREKIAQAMKVISIAGWMGLGVGVLGVLPLVMWAISFGSLELSLLAAVGGEFALVYGLVLLANAMPLMRSLAWVAIGLTALRPALWLATTLAVLFVGYGSLDWTRYALPIAMLAQAAGIAVVARIL